MEVTSAHLLAGRSGRRKAHASVVLSSLPEGADLAGRRGLQNPAKVILELRAQGIGDDLTARVRARQVARHDGPGGKKPNPGSFPLLYLAMVEEGDVSVAHFLDRVSDEVLRACGFGGWVPSISEIEWQFGRLEADADVFASIAQLLIRGAVASEPRITEIVFCDSTGWISGQPLSDACIDGVSCAAGSRDLWTGRRSDGISEFAQGHLNEADDPNWGERGYVEPGGRARRPYLEIVEAGDVSARMKRYGIYDLGGHVMRSLAWDCGIRYYKEQKKLWHGGVTLAAVSAFLGEPIAFSGGPADVQEYDFLPKLLDAVLSALGCFPQVMSFDRHYFVRRVFQICAERSIAPVAPERMIRGKSKHEDWRTLLFDEDGVPRCPDCGGVGNQSGPGLGLHQSRGGPVILARCLDLTRQRCGREFAVPCDKEWLKLTALSQLHPLYWAVAERHRNFERGFRHLRQRFTLAGKDISTSLYRPGVQAQELRAQAALLLLWLKLCLRNGWLAPLTTEVDVNTNKPARLSALQDRRSLAITEPGHGAALLRGLRERRERAGLHLPYGEAYDRVIREIRAEVEPG